MRPLGKSSATEKTHKPQQDHTTFFSFVEYNFKTFLLEVFARASCPLDDASNCIPMMDTHYIGWILFFKSKARKRRQGENDYVDDHKMGVSESVRQNT